MNIRSLKVCFLLTMLCVNSAHAEGLPAGLIDRFLDWSVTASGAGCWMMAACGGLFGFGYGRQAGPEAGATTDEKDKTDGGADSGKKKITDKLMAINWFTNGSAALLAVAIPHLAYGFAQKQNHAELVAAGMFFGLGSLYGAVLRKERGGANQFMVGNLTAQAIAVLGMILSFPQPGKTAAFAAIPCLTFLGQFMAKDWLDQRKKGDDYKPRRIANTYLIPVATLATAYLLRGTGEELRRSLSHI